MNIIYYILLLIIIIELILYLNNNINIESMKICNNKKCSNKTCNKIQNKLKSIETNLNKNNYLFMSNKLNKLSYLINNIKEEVYNNHKHLDTLSEEISSAREKKRIAMQS